MTNTHKILSIAFATVLLSGCSMFGNKNSQPAYQPLPPVKVITETVEVEIYAPPLPPEIQLTDVEWKVITNTPCKPATGKKTIPGSGGKWYYTTERFQYEDYVDDAGESKRRVVRDENGNRVELPQLLDDQTPIEVCGNLQQKIAEIESMLGGDFVILAVTPDGYENMAANLQEIKRYINQQKEIIYYYREATAPKGKEGWLEENADRQRSQLELEEADNASEYQQEVPAPIIPEEGGFNIRKLIPFGNN